MTPSAVLRNTTMKCFGPRGRGPGLRDVRACPDARPDLNDTSLDGSEQLEVPTGMPAVFGLTLILISKTADARCGSLVGMFRLRVSQPLAVKVAGLFSLGRLYY